MKRAATKSDPTMGPPAQKRDLGHNAEASKSSYADTLNKALQNVKISRIIFGSLAFRDLKMCRLVGKSWKKASDYAFKSRAGVYFDKYSQILDSSALPYSNFVSDTTFISTLRRIFQTSENEIPFDTLRLEGRIPGQASDLVHFFNNEGRFITKLILKKVSLHENEEKLQCLSLREIFLPNIQSLYIFTEGTQFIVCLKHLMVAVELELRHCVIDIHVGLRIAPRKLVMDSVTAICNEVVVKHLTINNIVDLEDTRYLVLEANAFTILNIDFGEELQVSTKEMVLNDVSILNGNDSEWKINTLTLFNTRLSPMNRLKVNRMEISYTNVDLSLLPKTLKWLGLDNVPAFISNQEFRLPHLEHLKLVYDDTEKEGIAQEYDNEWIPKSVKRIELEGVYITGNKRMKIDTLILNDYHFKEVDILLNVMALKNLVINNYNYRKTDNCYHNIQKMWRKPMTSILIGEFAFRNNYYFNNSEFAKYVGRRASFYLFSGPDEKGRAVKDRKVIKMLNSL